MTNSMGEREFSTTFNTVGVLNRLLFYPLGDAYHLPRHMFAIIPWWNQRKAHNFLMVSDPVYASGLHERGDNGQTLRVN